MVVAYVPLVIAVVGALMYAFAAHPKLSEIGRLVFFCGLFWLVWATTGHALKL